MYSHDELFMLVKDHIRANYKIDIEDADSGSGGYKESNALHYAQELVDELELAFVGAQKNGGVPSGGIKYGARITYTTRRTNEGFFVHINFPAKYLFRPSLWRDAGYTARTGNGINDIFALFTNGYASTSKMPSGFWESESRQMEVGFVKAPQVWHPDNFISETIQAFETKYPFIKVEYPEEWH